MKVNTLRRSDLYKWWRRFVRWTTIFLLPAGALQAELVRGEGFDPMEREFVVGKPVVVYGTMGKDTAEVEMPDLRLGLPDKVKELVARSAGKDHPSLQAPSTTQRFFVGHLVVDRVYFLYVKPEWLDDSNLKNFLISGLNLENVVLPIFSYSSADTFEALYGERRSKLHVLLYDKVLGAYWLEPEFAVREAKVDSLIQKRAEYHRGESGR